MANPLHIERMRSINFRLSHDCARIEAACGGDAWDREQIIDYLLQPNAFGKAAMNESGVVVRGYMLYRFVGGEIHMDRILVRPESRRTGVGAAMLQRLKERVGVDGIRRVVVLDLDDVSPDDDGRFCILYEDVRVLLKACSFKPRFNTSKQVEYVYEGNHA